MLLNTEKIVIMNTCLNYKYHYDNNVTIDNVEISPCISTKFLGVIIDNKLSFNDHIDTIVTKCNSRLF